MKELEKNLEATGGVPAEAELAAINRFAKSPLRAEEVYTFSLRLCDNEVAQHTGRPVRGEERHL